MDPRNRISELQDEIRNLESQIRELKSLDVFYCNSLNRLSNDRLELSLTSTNKLNLLIYDSSRVAEVVFNRATLERFSQRIQDHLNTLTEESQ